MAKNVAETLPTTLAETPDGGVSDVRVCGPVAGIDSVRISGSVDQEGTEPDTELSNEASS